MREILSAIADHPWAFMALVLGIYVCTPTFTREVTQIVKRDKGDANAR